MEVELRPGRSGDAEVCGRICYDAFGAIAAEHNFPTDFPTPRVGLDVASAMLEHPQIYSVVAEIDGEVVGSNFLDERPPVVGVGPVSVDPAAQNRGVYATDLGFTGHAVGESNDDLKALICSATAFHGSGILVPTTNTDLFRWCLERGLRVVHVMTLMTVGPYTTPRGAYLPSVQF